MKRRFIIGPRTFILVMLIGAMPSVGAQQQFRSSDEWSFTLTPYLWAVGIDGEVGLGRLPDVDIDAGFSDVWDALDFAFMGMFEARKASYGVMFDAFYARLSEDGDTSGPAFGDADVEVTHQFYSFAGTLRVLDGNAPLDLLAGIRYVHAKPAVDLNAGLLPARSRSGSEDWLDGFVGVRAHAPLSEHWSLTFYGDIGAGGSDFTWQALAGVHYRISERLDVQVGYRHFSMDYDEGGFLYDVAFSGPYAGIGIRF